MAVSFSKITRVLKQEGVRGLVRRALRSRRRDMVFFDRELAPEMEVPFLPRHPYVMRFLDAGELDLLRPHVSEAKFRMYSGRLERGMKVSACLTADETEVLGWCWTTGDAFYEPYDNATYVKVDGSFFHFDGEVVSEKRGRGIAFTAFPLIWPHWRARGYRQAHCTVDMANKPSMKLHERLGYTPREQFVVRTLLGFKWARPAGPRLRPGNQETRVR